MNTQLLELFEAKQYRSFTEKILRLSPIEVIAFFQFLALNISVFKLDTVIFKMYDVIHENRVHVKQ